MTQKAYKTTFGRPLPNGLGGPREKNPKTYSRPMGWPNTLQQNSTYRKRFSDSTIFTL